MAQSSIASYFNNRKRSAIEDVKINRARKVLVLDNFSEKSSVGINDAPSTKSQEKNGDIILVANKIVNINSRKTNRVLKTKKMKNDPNQQSISDLLTRINQQTTQDTQEMIEATDIEKKNCTTPPAPRKNAMDKVEHKPNGPSLKDIKRKMTRSARLADLKASISRFQDGEAKLKEIEKKTDKIEDSPKLKNFKTIELEIESRFVLFSSKFTKITLFYSPQKIFSPEKSYLSPRKEVSSARKNLINLLSPTKNACMPASPSKQILEETSKKGLTLPFKYRYLAEMFRGIDTICQILYNRKELITFNKLKPAVEEMLKRNLLERHLAQIKQIYPNAFNFKQEKLKVFGAGLKVNDGS